MKRLLIVLFIAACAPLASGCAMCCNTYDYAYPAYGGKWERGDREWGRVGSNLSGAGAAMIGETGTPIAGGQIIEQPTGGVISGGVIHGEVINGGVINGGVIGGSTDYPMYPVEGPLQ